MTTPVPVPQDRLVTILFGEQARLGWSITVAGKAAGYSQGTWSKVLNGTMCPSSEAVERFLAEAETPQDLRKEAMDLMQELDTQREQQVGRPKVAPYGSRAWRLLTVKVRKARSLSVLASMNMPVMLQCDEYWNVRISAMSEVERRVWEQHRQCDQRNLNDLARQFVFVLSESTLRHTFGREPAVMSQQMLHLAKLARHQNIGLFVVPFLTREWVDLYPCTIVDGVLVMAEVGNGILPLSCPPDVQRYGQMFEHARAQALPADQTQHFLGQLAADYRARQS